MKITRFVATTLLALSLAACGGGGGDTPTSPSASNPTTPTSPSTPANPSTPDTPKTGWNETTSTKIAYDGTFFGKAVLNNADGSTTLAFGGPGYASIAGTFTCDPVRFRALRFVSGVIVDDEGRINPGGTKAVHSARGLVADFNGDGVDDIYFGNSGCDNPNKPTFAQGERATLFLSNSSGTYTDASANLPPLLDLVHSAAIADTTKSGKPTILVGKLNMQITPGIGAPYNAGNNVAFGAIGPYTLKSNGDGTFTYQNDKIHPRIAAPLFALGDFLPSSFTASALDDIDGDGYPDLVVGADQKSRPAGVVYLNDGTGGFLNGPIIMPEGLFGADNTVTVGIQVVDLDGDGKKDLMLAQTSQVPFYTQGKIQVLKNTGSSFTDVTDTVIPNQNLNKSWSQYIHLVDLNGDGKLDLLLDNDLPQDGDVLAYSFDGTKFTAMTLNLPQLNSLTPMKIGGKQSLVSVQSHPQDNYALIKVYQYFN